MKIMSVTFLCARGQPAQCFSPGLKRQLRNPYRFRPGPAAAVLRRASKTTLMASVSEPKVRVLEGNREELDEGKFQETVAFDLGGPKLAIQDLSFAPGSTPIAVTIARPLGIVFQQKAGGIRDIWIEVDEIVEGGNAEKADVKVGDVLRCCTAVFTVQTPTDMSTWLNPNKKYNALAFYVTDNKNFEDCMNALISNGQPIDLPDGNQEEIDSISLVLERRSSDL